jgi:hypothetical protein
MSNKAAPLKGTSGYEIFVEYVPQRERMLRALLLALGEPPEEITLPLALRARGVRESPKNLENGAENAPPGRPPDGL